MATWNADGLFWNHADWLGTERARTGMDGSVAELCMDSPFGMNLRCTRQTDISPMHFTGKQHDAESGLDYFGARYDASSLGRFMTPDTGVDQHPANPQSWNLYAYTRNNPFKFVDPTGNFICGSSGSQDYCDTSKQAADKEQKSYTYVDTAGKQVVAHSVATTTKTDDKGNITTTVTSTTARYSTAEGHKGEFKGASQIVTTSVTSAEGKAISETSTGRMNIDEGHAAQSLGSAAVNSAIAQTVPSQARLFVRTVGQDMRAHPLKYVGAAVELGLAATPAGPVEVPKLAIELWWGALGLAHEAR